MREWGYPAIGVEIASEGHSDVMLDYKACGPRGEPRVAWVEERRRGWEIKTIAPDFTTFRDGLLAIEAWNRSVEQLRGLPPA
jgi:hypothetical protein